MTGRLPAVSDARVSQNRSQLMPVCSAAFCSVLWSQAEAALPGTTGSTTGHGGRRQLQQHGIAGAQRFKMLSSTVAGQAVSASGTGNLDSDSLAAEPAQASEPEPEPRSQ